MLETEKEENLEREKELAEQKKREKERQKVKKIEKMLFGKPGKYSCLTSLFLPIEHFSNLSLESISLKYLFLLAPSLYGTSQSSAPFLRP